MGATQARGWQALLETSPELNLKGEVGVTQVTVSVGDVSVSIPGREEGESRGSEAEVRGSRGLNQLWPFRDNHFDRSVESGFEEDQILRDPEAMVRSLDFILR